MKKYILSNLVILLLLVSSSIYLFNHQSKPIFHTYAASNDYTTDWTMTKCRTAGSTIDKICLGWEDDLTRCATWGFTGSGRDRKRVCLTYAQKCNSWQDLPASSNVETFLGPAEWKVDIKIDGVLAATETWTVNNWKNTKDFLWSPQNFRTIPTDEKDDNDDVICQRTSWGNYANGATTSGLYGYTYSGDGEYGRASSGSSIPLNWHVEGDLIPNT